MEPPETPGPLWPVLRPVLLGIGVALVALGLLALASDMNCAVIP